MTESSVHEAWWFILLAESFCTPLFLCNGSHHFVNPNDWLKAPSLAASNSLITCQQFGFMNDGSTVQIFSTESNISEILFLGWIHCSPYLELLRGCPGGPWTITHCVSHLHFTFYTLATIVPHDNSCDSKCSLKDLAPKLFITLEFSFFLPAVKFTADIKVQIVCVDGHDILLVIKTTKNNSQGFGSGTVCPQCERLHLFIFKSLYC